MKLLWEIILGYALETIFGEDIDAFEVGGTIVQTTDDVASTSPPAGQASLASNNNVDYHDPSLVCRKPETTKSRHMVQVGFNPFAPILIYGAEQLYNVIASPEQRDVYD